MKKTLNPNRMKPGWPGVGNTRAVNDAPPRDPLGRGASLARARPEPQTLNLNPEPGTLNPNLMLLALRLIALDFGFGICPKLPAYVRGEEGSVPKALLSSPLL